MHAGMNEVRPAGGVAYVNADPKAQPALRV
jgi:hypothetical protein